MAGVMDAQHREPCMTCMRVERRTSKVKWCSRTRCSERPDMVTNACFATDLPCCMSVPRRAELLTGRNRGKVDVAGDGGSKVPRCQISKNEAYESTLHEVVG